MQVEVDLVDEHDPRRRARGVEPEVGVELRATIREVAHERAHPPEPVAEGGEGHQKTIGERQQQVHQVEVEARVDAALDAACDGLTHDAERRGLGGLPQRHLLAHLEPLEHSFDARVGRRPVLVAAQSARWFGRRRAIDRRRLPQTTRVVVRDRRKGAVLATHHGVAELEHREANLPVPVVVHRVGPTVRQTPAKDLLGLEADERASPGERFTVEESATLDRHRPLLLGRHRTRALIDDLSHVARVEGPGILAHEPLDHGAEHESQRVEHRGLARAVLADDDVEALDELKRSVREASEVLELQLLDAHVIDRSSARP
jgi:hypothetical protein